MFNCSKSSKKWFEICSVPATSNKKPFKKLKGFFCLFWFFRLICYFFKLPFFTLLSTLDDQRQPKPGATCSRMADSTCTL